MYVYILKLIHNKYYVGRTEFIIKRILNHFKLTGSYWTKKYDPISVINIVDNCDKYDEDKYTIQMMDKYGINNVRGGTFSNTKLSCNQIQTIIKMINNANDRCFVCFEDHFVTRCRFKYINFDNTLNKFLCKLIISLSDYDIGDNKIHMNDAIYCLHKIEPILLDGIDINTLCKKLNIQNHNGYINYFILSFKLCFIIHQVY